MVRYRKGIDSGVMRVPQVLKEVFGDEIEIAPGLRAAAIYGSKEDKKRVIRSLQLVIRDLREEIAIDKEKEAEMRKVMEGSK